MTKVFFGGSRNVRILNDELKVRTDKIISNYYHILVGDANGADKVMQRYLFAQDYRHITVYCMEDACRNNVGGWKTENIRTDRKTKDFTYFSTKDQRMSEDADYGFMLWDGKSKGTLNNIVNLCERNKKTLVYYTPEDRFYTIARFGDVSELLTKCDEDTLRLFESSIHITERVKSRQQALDFNGEDFGQEMPI